MPIVGIRTTPTKNSDSPNVLDERLDRTDEDLGQEGEQAGRRDEQDDDRRPAGPGGPAVARRRLVAAERVRGVRELEDERQGVADDQQERDEDRLLDDRPLADRGR